MTLDNQFNREGSIAMWTAFDYTAVDNGCELRWVRCREQRFDCDVNEYGETVQGVQLDDVFMVKLGHLAQYGADHAPAMWEFVGIEGESFSDQDGDIWPTHVWSESVVAPAFEDEPATPLAPC